MKQYAVISEETVEGEYDTLQEARDAAEEAAGCNSGAVWIFERLAVCEMKPIWSGKPLPDDEPLPASQQPEEGKPALLSPPGLLGKTGWP